MGSEVRYLRLGDSSYFKMEKNTHIKIVIYGAKLRLSPYLSILILVNFTIT